MSDTFNIVRIEAFTHKKHLLHPGFQSQEEAKKVLKDMAVANVKQGVEVYMFELAFTTVENQDLYRVEEAKYFREYSGG